MKFPAKAVFVGLLLGVALNACGVPLLAILVICFAVGVCL